MKNEKKMYEEPRLEVVRFTAEDVITTSTGGGSREPAELDEIED